MPFIKQHYNVKTPLKAHVFMREILGLSAKQAQRFIDKRRLFVDGIPFLNKSGLISGDVEVSMFEARDLGIKPIFKTADFALFDKPPKLLTHPKGRFYHDSLLDSIKFHYGSEANPTHRLDYETSGLVLAALNKHSEIALKNAFEARQIAKCYQAHVHGNLRSRTIDLPIIEQDKKRDLGIRSIVSPQGKRAITRIESVAYNPARDSTFVLAYPLTGRTHQIRVHLAHIGHKIIGECLYGVEDSLARAYLDGKLNDNERKLHFGESRLMLHAHRLQFTHNGARYDIVSPISLEPSP